MKGRRVWSAPAGAGDRQAPDTAHAPAITHVATRLIRDPPPRLYPRAGCPLVGGG
jgi:hypothetical protein